MDVLRRRRNKLSLVILLILTSFQTGHGDDESSPDRGGDLFSEIKDLLHSLRSTQRRSESEVQIRPDLWMTQLPERVKNRPLRSISIPGSHDSFALFDEMHLDNNFTPGEYNREEQFVMSFFRKEVKDWSVAQNLSATEQLTLGIRYLDLRIAYSYANKSAPLDYYAEHGLIAGRILPKLIAINRFLQTRPEEIVILDFQAIFNVSLPTYTVLANFITAIFGPKIFPCSKMDPLEMSLKGWTALRKQVLVLFDHPSNSSVFDDFCGRAILKNPWADTTKLSVLLPFLTDNFDTRNKTLFYVVQGMLTTRLTSVLTCIFGNCVTLETYAESTNPAMVNWLADKQDVNIVLTDYSQIGNIVPTVIMKNYE